MPSLRTAHGTRTLVALAVVVALWCTPGCGHEGEFFPDADVLAIESALLRLACTLRESALGEYAALLHTGYSDGFLGRDEKIAQMKLLFDTGFFSVYTFQNPVIWMDNDRARVMVDETFRYGDVNRSQQDMQEWRKEDGVWKIYRQNQPDPSVQLAQDLH